MASIHEEIRIQADPATVWDAVRDLGAIHTRLAPGVVVGTEILAGVEPLTRRVTFGHGPVVDEVIVDLDDARRRLVWTIVGEPVEHHNGVLQVFEAEPGWTRAVWTADVLPHALAEPFGMIMGQGLAAMKRHLEGAAER